MATNNPDYEVIVGNVGCIVRTESYALAVRVFNEYVAISKRSEGRAGDEDVTLLEDGEPVREHRGYATEED